MLTAPILSLLTILSTSSLALAGHGGPGGLSNHATRRRAFEASRLRKRVGADPSTIAVGSLTTAEGCTAFYHVAVGDWCYVVADKFNITLADFYSLNPEIDSECHNLWAGYDYCVARQTGSSSSAATSSAAVSATSTKVSPTTTSKHTTSTHKASSSKKSTVAKTSSTKVASTKIAVKVAATPAPTTSSSSSDDDEGDCEADDGDDDADDSSSVAPASTSSSVAFHATTTKAVAAAAQQASSSSSSSSAAATTTAAVSSTNRLSLLSTLGVTAFTGENNSGIGSWFRADNSQDSTNGHSWCGFPYTDASVGFAPSVDTMIAAAGGDETAAKQAYCGLEATVTAPDGTTVTGVILDGFADPWVLTPFSIDIMLDTFSELYGSTPDSKDEVMQGVKWTLNGQRNPKYAYNGVGDPSS